MHFPESIVVVLEIPKCRHPIACGCLPRVSPSDSSGKRLSVPAELSIVSLTSDEEVKTPNAIADANKKTTLDIYLNYRVHWHHWLHHVDRLMALGHVVLRDYPLVNHVTGLEPSIGLIIGVRLETATELRSQGHANVSGYQKITNTGNQQTNACQKSGPAVLELYYVIFLSLYNVTKKRKGKCYGIIQIANFNYKAENWNQNCGWALV